MQCLSSQNNRRECKNYLLFTGGFHSFSSTVSPLRNVYSFYVLLRQWENNFVMISMKKNQLRKCITLKYSIVVICYLSNLFNSMILPQHSNKTSKQLAGSTFQVGFKSLKMFSFLSPIGKLKNDSKKIQVQSLSIFLAERGWFSSPFHHPQWREFHWVSCWWPAPLRSPLHHYYR